MQEILLEFFKQGAGVALAFVIFHFARRDQIEARKRREELAEQFKQETILNREALIDSIKVSQNLISVVENNVKISEKLLEKLNK